MVEAKGGLDKLGLNGLLAGLVLLYVLSLCGNQALKQAHFCVSY
jgi:hypothetical protein